MMKFYISNLRNIATFSVILLHVSGAFLYKYHKIEISSWKLANLIDSSVRFCVPVFLMITGTLLLNNKDTLKDFINKRLRRVLYPLLFWSVIYFIWSKIDVITSTDFFSLLADFVKALSRGASFHFWYIYTIIGVYLFIPIFKKWVLTSSKREIEYFLIIWGVTLLYNPYTIKFLPNFELIYFSRFIGYVLLGYYVDKYIVANKKSLFIGMVFLITGITATYFLTQIASDRSNTFVEVFYDYLSPNVALSALGVFLIGQNFTYRSHFSESLDKNSFGIYFIHIIIFTKTLRVIDVSNFENNALLLFIYIILNSIFVYFTSFIIIFLLSKILYLKKFLT